MKREYYLLSIEMQLSAFMSMVALRNSAGRFDLNILAEGFLKGLLNILYGYNLENLNIEKKNVPSIDLADKTNRIAFQITSSDSAKKIRSTIQTFISNRLYEQYDRLRFLIIKGERNKYPKAAFQTQGQLLFNKDEDILAFRDLFHHIDGLETEKIIQIAKYLDSELPELLENLANLIRDDTHLVSSPASKQVANNLKLYLFNVGSSHNILLHLPNGEYGLINFSYEGRLNQTEPPSLTYLKGLIREGLAVTIAFVLITDISYGAVKGVSSFCEWAIENKINVREIWLGPSFLMSIFDIAGLQKFERHHLYRSTFEDELFQRTLTKDRYKRLDQFRGISEIIGFTTVRDKTPKFLINTGQILLQRNTHRLSCLSSVFHVPYAPVLLIEAGSYRLIFGGEASRQAWARIHKELQEENIEHEADLIIASRSGSKHSSDKKVWRSLMGEHKTVHVMFSASKKPYGHPHRETLRDLLSVASEKNIDLHVHSTDAATSDIVKTYPVVLKKSHNRPLLSQLVEESFKSMRPARSTRSQKSSLIAFEAEFLNDGLKNIIVRGIISEPPNES